MFTLEMLKKPCLRYFVFKNMCKSKSNSLPLNFFLVFLDIDNFHNMNTFLQNHSIKSASSERYKTPNLASFGLIPKEGFIVRYNSLN